MVVVSAVLVKAFGLGMLPVLVALAGEGAGVHMEKRSRRNKFSVQERTLKSTEK